MFRQYILSTGDKDEASLKAAEHIDLLTYNRIQDFGALTENQQNAVLRAHRALRRFETENADMLDNSLKSYSVNGVSMSFGSDGMRMVSGVTVPASIYAVLQSTGLCCPVI